MAPATPYGREWLNASSTCRAVLPQGLAPYFDNDPVPVREITQFERGLYGLSRPLRNGSVRG
jgi:hypothetical protein